MPKQTKVNKKTKVKQKNRGRKITVRNQMDSTILAHNAVSQTITPPSTLSFTPCSFAVLKGTTTLYDENNPNHWRKAIEVIDQRKFDRRKRKEVISPREGLELKQRKIAASAGHSAEHPKMNIRSLLNEQSLNPYIFTQDTEAYLSQLKIYTLFSPKLGYEIIGDEISQDSSDQASIHLSR